MPIPIKKYEILIIDKQMIWQKDDTSPTLDRTPLEEIELNIEPVKWYSNYEMTVYDHDKFS